MSEDWTGSELDKEVISIPANLLEKNAGYKYKPSVTRNPDSTSRSDLILADFLAQVFISAKLVKMSILPSTRRLLRSLGTLLHILYCFVVMYLSLLIFLIPILLLIVIRFLISISFALFTGGKYKLLECSNAALGLDRYANVLTINFFAYLEGPCDLEFLRERIKSKFTQFKLKDGSRPYEVMLCSIVKKMGFFCWQNRRHTFDIREHIRFLPGCSDPNRVYTEAEVFDAAASLADDIWDDSRPRWEFLVVLKMRKDGCDEICSVIHMRIHHAYVDGISFAQNVLLVLGDKPASKFIFDPVHPPIPPVSLCMKLFTYLQVLVLGPWASLRFMGREENHIFYEGPNTGGKFFGRTKMDIPIESMREIRRFHGCSTSAIQHQAFTGALVKLALKKGYSTTQIPDSVLGAVIFAFLPYPHEYPQNNVAFGIESFPLGEKSQSGVDSEQLTEVNRVCGRLTSPLNYYALVTSRLFLKIMGLFPVAIIEKSMGSIKMAYYVSNVPGIADMVVFNGQNIVNVFGTGPLMNGIRYSMGVGCYRDNFAFAFLCEKSNLIKSRADMDDLVEAFEDEIKILMESVRSKAHRPKTVGMAAA